MIIFGNAGDEEVEKRGYLSIDDSRLSKEHFQIEVDAEGNWLNIIDLGSQFGTWLVILNYLEDQVLPEIEYQSPEIGAFKFELGTSCYTLEEMLEAYEAPEILTDLCLLDMYTLTDIKEVKQHELETKVTKAMITPDRMEQVLHMMGMLQRDFHENGSCLKNRIILKVISGKYEGITIEVEWPSNRDRLSRIEDRNYQQQRGGESGLHQLQCFRHLRCKPVRHQLQKRFLFSEVLRPQQNLQEVQPL